MVRLTTKNAGFISTASGVPTLLPTPTHAPAHAPADLSDWRSAEDAASGKTYYYNEVTQATSWVWPPA